MSFTYGLVTAIASDVNGLDPARRQTQRNSEVWATDARTGERTRILAVLRGDEARVVVPSDEIADVMKQAIVAIEDRRFFEHRGVDFRAVIRAVWANVRRSKVVEGGSTITQQFIKNAYLTQKRSVSRKVREAYIAWQIEQKWSKDRILTAYLNTIFFGHGAYGVEEAARVYFGRPAKRLALPQAALLAGIPQDPSLYDPVANPRQARARRRLVLRNMLEEGLITYPQFRRANRTPLPSAGQIRLPAGRGPAQYFTNYVTQQLVDELGTRRVFGGGLRVDTTVDLHLQDLARAAVEKWLPAPDGPAAALVAIDPRDGRVLAMYGGRSFRESQFNLAVQGERQAGSAFKPLALAAALTQGVAPQAMFVSKPVTIPLGDRLWSVHNYEGANLGPIDLEQATIHSDNTVYAQLGAVVGPKNIAAMARKLGVRSALEGFFSIVLGGEAVNPLELARAYATIADGGERVDGSVLGDRPRAVLGMCRIESRARCVQPQSNRPVKTSVLSANTSAVITRFLQGVVREGTGRRAALPDGRPVAGKTGTTENYGDAWFVGYTPQLVTAVWVGYPNGLRPMLTEYHGDPVAGGTFPALIFKSFMEGALSYLDDAPQGFPYAGYPLAEQRRLVLRDGAWQEDNGYCRGEHLSVLFATGERPPLRADCKVNEVEVPRVVGQTLAGAQAVLADVPLRGQAIYRPALPGEPTDRVLEQLPKPGARLSSFDTVRLVFGKALHGAMPRVEGAPAAAAVTRLRRLGLEVTVIRQDPGAGAVGRAEAGRVLRQNPRAGTALGPGLRVRLTVARAVATTPGG